MSPQADYVVSNGTGAAVRSDINGQLAAIVSQNSGATEPATMYAYQWWADTTTGLLKIRNSANNAWVTVGTLASANLGLLSSGGTLVAALGSASTPGITFTGDLNTGIYSPAADTIAFAEGGVESARIDSSGRLLVGTSSTYTDVVGGAGGYNGSLWLATNESVGTGPFISTWTNSSSLDPMGTSIVLSRSKGNAIGTHGILANGDGIGTISFNGSDGTNFISGAIIRAAIDGTPGVNDLPTRLVFSTTADGASSPTERMRINSLGNAFIGGGGVTTQAATRLIITNPNATENQSSLIIENSSFFASIYCFNVNTGGVSTTNAAMWVQKSSSTSRSINAAGTINASGADYAEYMTKGGDFTITKGDICGIDPDGKLTTSFINSISFVVKSTNPSYVGSDTWGSEAAIGKKPDVDDLEVYAQWESDLEAARQTVDRIAFAGQVPVNVTGATPGQYIVPVESADGGIEGIAKNEADLTLAEYMRAVGKVIAIEDDGRARVIVKVA